MNEWLAKVYGTAGETSSDLEKTASLALLETMAAQEGIDLSTLSPEQLEAVYNEVMSDPEVLGQTAQETQTAAPQAQQGQAQPQAQAQAQQAQQGQPLTEEMLMKEAQAKFEEADFLGRVMAHSYTDEMAKIAASAGLVDPNGNGVSGGSSIKGHVGKALDKVRNAGKGAVNAVESAGRKVDSGVATGAKWVGNQASRVGSAVGGAAKAVGGHVARHAGKYTMGGLAAAGIGGGAALAHHMNKEAAALEKLAEIRAQEILAANGISPEGQQAAPAQQEPSLEEQVEARAREMLTGAGYTFQD